MKTTEEKSALYAGLLPQIKALVGGETDQTANMANISAALSAALHHHWTGFYIVRGEELVLGPFQGPVACTRIGFGRGVCGTAWKERRTIIVPNVEEFVGHIACSTLSRSEIVVPVLRDGTVRAVLDIDSTDLNAFDADDARFLERIAALL